MISMEAPMQEPEPDLHPPVVGKSDSGRNGGRQKVAPKLALDIVAKTQLGL